MSRHDALKHIQRLAEDASKLLADSEDQDGPAYEAAKKLDAILAHCVPGPDDDTKPHPFSLEGFALAELARRDNYRGELERVESELATLRSLLERAEAEMTGMFYEEADDGALHQDCCPARWGRQYQCKAWCADARALLSDIRKALKK